MGEISIAPLNLNLGPGQSDKKLNFKIGMPPTMILDCVSSALTNLYMPTAGDATRRSSISW